MSRFLLILPPDFLLSVKHTGYQGRRRRDNGQPETVDKDIEHFGSHKRRIKKIFYRGAGFASLFDSGRG